jgi:multimeric flavodoxin WrbA
MRIILLNGESNHASAFQKYLSLIMKRLAESGHSATLFNLAELNLKGCSGCFSCWVKTPGECAKRDDSLRICRAAINADLVLLASPLVMGFTTALLKRAADQLIQIIHPYFVIQGGEVHHRARYERYPKFALLLGAGCDSDTEDIEITTALWARTARNMKSRMVFNALSNRPAQEVADEIALVA